MADGDGLISAVVMDGRGGARSLDWEGVRAWEAGDGVLWLHLDRKAETSARWLTGESGLDAAVCDALLAEDTRPRFAAHGGGAVLILRGVNLNPGAEPDDMISIRMWVEAGRVISLRFPKLAATNEVREQLDAGRGPGTSGEFVAALAAALTRGMRPVLENLDEVIGDLEERGVSAASAGLRRELGAMRRQAIVLRRYIGPQREAVSHLVTQSPGWLDARSAVSLRETNDTITRYVEDLDAMRERAAVIQEEISGRLGEQMNKTMYVLSLIATVFLPLGFVTGLLGINVAGMPGADWSPAFWVVCVGLAVVAAVQVWLFRRMKIL